MPRKMRTVKELQEASNHLQYEISILTSLAHGRASGFAGQGSIANALLESFIIHVRAVMDFLYADKPQTDDIIAEDFFDTPQQWTDKRPTLSELLSQTKRRAGKEVAHLTYARLDVKPETKPWPFVQITNEISTVINKFLEHVQKNKLSSQLLAHI
jgi:hypothetical protein